MLKRRVSLYLAMLFIMMLLMTLSSAMGAAAPMFSVYATLEGDSHQYTATVGTYATLEIFFNDPGTTRLTARTLTLSLPNTVSIYSVSSGNRNGNTITGWNGSSLSVELYLKGESYKFPSGQYQADPIRMTYTIRDGMARVYETQSSLFVGVNRAGDTSSFVTNLAAAYPYDRYFDAYYPGYNYGYYPISKPGYYPGYYWDYGYDHHDYVGWWSTPSSYDFWYDDVGFWQDGKYYPYGSQYNGWTFYARNPLYPYNPYSSLNDYYGIALNTTSMSLGVGQSQQLTVNVGAFGSAYGLNWSSSNAQVAAVDSNGLVTGLSNGTASITVRATYGTTATCTVTVGAGAPTVGSLPVPAASSAAAVSGVTSLKFSNRTPKTIKLGEEVQMYIVIEPKDTNYGSTQIQTTNPDIIQVLEGGRVRGVAPGSAEVFFTFGGKTAMHKFTVK